MSVIHWNPLRNPLREFDDLFAHAGHKQRLGQANGSLKGARFTPPADIAETDAGYVIELELPGFAADDVAVSVHDGVLSVAGERKPTHLRDTAVAAPADTDSEGQAPVATQEARRVHRTERAFGAFERRFRLPKDADVSDVRATASNGVLTLEVARLAEATRRSIEVKVA